MSIVPNYPKQNRPIFSGTRVIGLVSGDIFKKTIIGSKHFLRMPPAIAFDVSTLEDAERAGATTVEVIDKETSVIYRTSIYTIWKMGKRFNRGHGNQIFLPICNWSINGKPPSVVTPPGNTPVAPNQPHLF